MRKQRGKGFSGEFGFGDVPELYYPFLMIAGISLVVCVGILIALLTMSSLSATRRAQMRNAAIAMGIITVLSLFGGLMVGGSYY